MVVAGAIGIAELTLALHDIPRSAREANETAARVFGSYLSATLDNRVDEIVQLANSTLVWTALSDSRDRDAYLAPFLEDRNRALPSSQLALLDYRGRFVAGDSRLPERGDDAVALLVEQVLSRQTPATKLISVPDGRFWVGVPIEFPYAEGVIGVLLGAIDLEAMLSSEVAEELRERGVIIRGGDTQWQLRGEPDRPGFARATYALHHPDIPHLYDLQLEVHSTTSPWQKPLLIRGAVLVLASIAAASLVWWLAGMVAGPVSRRLERLAEVIVENPACAPEDIPADMRGDEIAVLGDALRRALVAHRKAEHELAQLAYFDKLTGLMNRARFEERVDDALKRARRADTEIALLFVDLDRFKAVNDTLGHEAGDTLLKQVAQRIIDRVRTTDAVSRRSGDEFTLLVESSKEKTGAAHFAEDLIARLSEPYRLDSGAIVNVGASIGIAFYPSDGETVGELLRCADTAMYAAKERGAGSYCLYSRDMGVAVRDRLELEARLTQAVHAGELEVCYQPQVRLSDGRMIGVEALCRWHDAALGEVPPSVFIPIAEETGLIRPLGLWLFRQACREVACWDKPEEGLALAVNISTVQLTDDFIALLRELQANCRASGTRLELELNEASLVRARPEVAAVLDALNALGVAVVMDDFGSHYSSLRYLRHFKFSKLKIDLSSIEGLETSEEDALMTSTLISVAHQLGLEVIAEGVETEEQRDRLIAEGCDLAQGFLFGRPVAGERLRTAAVPA